MGEVIFGVDFRAKTRSVPGDLIIFPERPYARSLEFGQPTPLAGSLILGDFHVGMLSAYGFDNGPSEMPPPDAS